MFALMVDNQTVFIYRIIIWYYNSSDFICYIIITDGTETTVCNICILLIYFIIFQFFVVYASQLC